MPAIREKRQNPAARKPLCAYTMNLAFNFEPLCGILAAALLFGEHQQLHPLFYAGLATILAANVLHPLVLRKIRRRSKIPGNP